MNASRSFIEVLKEALEDTLDRGFDDGDVLTLSEAITKNDAGAISVARDVGTPLIVTEIGDPERAVHIRMEGVMKVIAEVLGAMLGKEKVPIAAAATYLAVIFSLKDIARRLDRDQVRVCRILLVHGARQQLWHRVLPLPELEKLYRAEEGADQAALTKAIAGLTEAECLEVQEASDGRNLVILLDHAVIRFPAVEPLTFFKVTHG
jgi:hypothetical protein